jgi:hypothetical protein
MHSHHVKDIAKHGADIVKDLAPLTEPKNPAVAFGVGLVFGAIGVAIYLKSAKDFFVCMAMFFALSLLLPGLGSVLGWVFAAVYGAWRAHTSNENLGL